MAFFKFRKGGDDHPTPPPAAQSVEAVRKRARRRLIGSAVLVLAGVIGFPLLFDSQPRPIAVDIPIEIPDRNTVKPLAGAPRAVAVAPSRSVGEEGGGAAPSSAKKLVAKPDLKEELILDVKPAVKPEVKPEQKIEIKPPPVKMPEKVPEKAAERTPEKGVEKPPEKAPEKSAEKVLTKPDDSARAQALLEGRATENKPTAAVGRFVVQVGAYSDVPKAQEVRLKLERAGMKTYAQVVESKEGKRIRVRVGPFETKAQADKVAEKIRKLDLPTGILEL